MIYDINLSLFNFINVISITSINEIKFIIFLAKKIIFILPLIIITYWFWGLSNNLFYQRIFVIKTIFAVIISLIISSFIRIIFPQERPFMLGIGQYFLLHNSTSSFPSNHATIAFTFTLGFLFWLRRWMGLVFFILTIILSWARVFLGLHWVLDIIGAFLVAIISCFISQKIWNFGGYKLQPYIIIIYQNLCAFLIKKKWIKN